MFPSSSFELSKILSSVLLLAFTSLFCFSLIWTLDSSVINIPGMWNVWEHREKIYANFLTPFPPFKERISIRILKAVFTLVTWCLWKEEHDVGLFLLPEMYSLHHFPLPARPHFLDKNRDAPPLRWNTRVELLLSLTACSLQAPILLMRGMSLFLSSSHNWSLMLVLLRLGADVGRKKRHWEDSDRRRPIDRDSGVLRRKRLSSGYWLFPDRNVLDCIFFRSSHKVAVGSICKEIYYAYM